MFKIKLESIIMGNFEINIENLQKYGCKKSLRTWKSVRTFNKLLLLILNNKNHIIYNI